jgi:hypothetical protein
MRVVVVPSCFPAVSETFVVRHVAGLDAEDCYLNVMRGPLDGTGSVGSFDAAACYASRTSARGPSVVIR